MNSADSPTRNPSSPDPSEVPNMSTELTYEEVLRIVGDNLTVLAEALEKEVSETRCACCDQRTFQPLDKSRALEQVHGMLDKVNRFAQSPWAKTVVP